VRQINAPSLHLFHVDRMATQSSSLNPQFCVEELKTSEADSAFPLIRAIAPEVSIEDWRDYVRRRSMQGGILGLLGADGEISGLLSYRLGERLRHGTVLALDDFVTFELSQDAPGRRALLAAAKELAKELGCTGIELRIGPRGIADAASPKVGGWVSLGLDLDSVMFATKLSKPAAG
jgi:hypothetical protein